MSKQIKLGAFLPGAGQHVAAWRHPEANAQGNHDLAYYQRLAQTAERGLFDAYFLADGLSVEFGGDDGSGVSSKGTGFEPVTLFAALSVVTQHIGFIATASTTYEEPYTTARKFASLDLISGGRAGWNVVTTTGDPTAQNFNRDTQLPHAALRVFAMGERAAARCAVASGCKCLAGSHPRGGKPRRAADRRSGWPRRLSRQLHDHLHLHRQRWWRPQRPL